MRYSFILAVHYLIVVLAKRRTQDSRTVRHRMWKCRLILGKSLLYLGMEYLFHRIVSYVGLMFLEMIAFIHFICFA